MRAFSGSLSWCGCLLLSSVVLSSVSRNSLSFMISLLLCPYLFSLHVTIIVAVALSACREATLFREVSFSRACFSTRVCDFFTARVMCQFRRRQTKEPRRFFWPRVTLKKMAAACSPSRLRDEIPRNHIGVTIYGLLVSHK